MDCKKPNQRTPVGVELRERTKEFPEVSHLVSRKAAKVELIAFAGTGIDNTSLEELSPVVL